MNDEYEERGVFKQLVIIAYAVYVWCALKIERAWRSQLFWWACSILCVAVVIYCMFKLLMRTVQ
jgi:hypothetical protein